MKKIIKNILSLLIICLTFSNIFADDNDRNEFVSWERPNISNIYNESEQKFVFLVQFDTHDYTDQVYKYDFRIGTNERWRTCTWEFIVKDTTIYMVCWVLITDASIINQEYTLYLEVRDTNTNNQELEFYQTYNIWITSDDVSNFNSPLTEEKNQNIDKDSETKNINNSWEESDTPEDSKSEELQGLEIEIDQRLEIFFQKIEWYSSQRKLALINKVLSLLEQIHTKNENKIIIIQIIKKKFLEEKKILQN